MSDEEEQPVPKWRKHLKSGLHRIGATTVLKKVTWPHEVVYTSDGKLATYTTRTFLSQHIYSFCLLIILVNHSMWSTQALCTLLGLSYHSYAGDTIQVFCLLDCLDCIQDMSLVFVHVGGKTGNHIFCFVISLIFSNKDTPLLLLFRCVHPSNIYNISVL